MEDSEKADSEPVSKSDDASPSNGKSCALCGSGTPAVRCDRCNSQIFCLSCDDMYHRHPKRKLHLRKAVDSIWSSARSPRLRRRTDLPGDPCKIPIPPPRTKKRERHTIGGRIFLKSGLELGSFGHSKVFDSKNLMPSPKDIFSGQKSPASMVESNCDDDTSSQNIRNQSGQIYENDSIPNQDGNLKDRSPWNETRPNISSPIQVSIPSSSPDIVTNGQAFGYPTKPQSQSEADLTAHSGHAVGHHPYHFHPPYPYMHPPMHPSYSHSMAHLNCPQCISSSWSNLMSPHPSPYFHPMPWGSAQNTMSRGPHPMVGQAGPMKHSHGDLVSYPDSNFHYPYPGAGYYHNGPPVVDPNFIKDLHEHAEMQKMKKRSGESKSSPSAADMMDTTDAAIEDETNAVGNESTTEAVSANQDVQRVDEEEPVAPQPPSEPWSCLHCTFINPPGIYICQVCCKTSYGNKLAESEDQPEARRRMSRDSESPLINRDALLNSPDVPRAQKDEELMEYQPPEPESKDINLDSEISEIYAKLTTETQTSTTTKSTDVQTQNIHCKSIASSTDSIFPKQEISVQTEGETIAQTSCSVATDPMISSQSMESLLSGVSAPPYHNRRAGWGRGATSFSTQSLYERGRSRSPMPRSASMYNEARVLGHDSNFPSEEAMHSLSQAWLYSDPMYYKPHNQGLGQALSKEDYFDGTWGSMDKLNRRVKHKKDKGKVEPKPKFHRSLDDLKSDKRPEMVHTQELMMLQTVKEAERCGFSLEDLHVAYLHCGRENPVYWLEDNWSSMVKNVIALAAKYGEDNEENDVGVITSTEAKEALRIHRGDIWDAVTECIENRQRKILELTVRGNFTQKQISDALKINEGNVELAYADLLRASTRRHKFILSPGLSEDSEDLNLYNPTEDSTTDHPISHSPMKIAKHDVNIESKMEKKKSDFLTKLSAIRQAQSERRKAREEKELIRENITQESEVALKDKLDIPSEGLPVIRQDSEKMDEMLITQEDALQVSVDTENIPEQVPEVVKNIISVKEGADDNIPVDFDTNWEDSQGQWIEEFSDEQWEDDAQWVGLGKKFQKMEKEFEEEAMQMAALWEKEELEDDVFEDENKVAQTEEAPDTQKKFDDWVKANLKAESSEYEEEEIKTKAATEDISNASLRDSLELEVSRPSPLQHYPTEYDLSKSQMENDWENLPADEEIEKLAHDIVCEGSDIENKFDEAEITSYGNEKKLRKSSDQEISDEDWEKIELDEQLQEMNELDHFTFIDRDSGEIESDTLKRVDENFNETGITSDVLQITTDKDLNVTYKNIDLVPEITDEHGITSDVSQITTDKDLNVTYNNVSLVSESTDDVKPTDADSLQNSTDKVRRPSQKLSSSDGDQPKAPVRRKSKLNSDAIQQALENQAMIENKHLSSDIPPALPEKTKNKESRQVISDIYAVPDKASKASQQEVGSVLQQLETLRPVIPEKPPRLSPLSSPQNTLQRSLVADKGHEVPSKSIPYKDVSPVTSLSNESDSNCFADSESDTEIRRHRLKNIHRKPAKYENEFDELEGETPKYKGRLEKMTLEDESDLRLHSDHEHEDEFDSELLEPLPPMKDIDFNPELPILLAGRGSRMSELDDVDSPKAFREDTARPLQLFKAVKRETPTNTLNFASSGLTESDFNKNFAYCTEETSFVQKTSEESMSLASLEPVPSTITEVSSKTDEVQVEFASTDYENQPTDIYYYNEAVSPKSNYNQNISPPSNYYNQAVSSQMNYFDESVPPQMNLAEIQLPDQNEMHGKHQIDELVPEESHQENFGEIARSPSPTEEDEMGFTEMEGMSAAVDYFFGRYNEVTVTRPKKKTPVRAKSGATTNKQMPPSTMSQSEITSKAKVLSQMEKSSAAALEEQSAVQNILPNDQTQKQQVSTKSPKEIAAANKAKEPTPDEYLPFAEDYLFGCYNQVVIPKKPKKKPIPLAPIPKSGSSTLTRSSSFQKELKPSAPLPAPPEVPAKEPVEESAMDNESVLSEDISADTSVYDDIFHDLPTEILNNQSFDDGGSIYYESFQDAVEEMQDTPSIDGNVVSVRSKTVHFEEPQVPVVPPRRHKAPGVQKAQMTTSITTADEYLFRQYEMGPSAKKKLPVCSEDFKINQGLEPTKFPCDTPLQPDEQREGVLFLETSVDSLSKPVEPFKYSSECDFEVFDQPLDLVKYENGKTTLSDEVSSSIELQDSTLYPEDSSVSRAFLSGTISDTISGDVKQDINIQCSDISQNVKIFQDLCVPELPSEDLDFIEENNIAPHSLSCNMAETVRNNEMQVAKPQEMACFEQDPVLTSSSTNRLEMDQFVFVQQSDSIMDDSYNLFDIENLESSIASELNYIDLRNNIEEECGNDSEQEWKRNEDLKNSLNASFIGPLPNQRITPDQDENILDESPKSSVEESKDNLSVVDASSIQELNLGSDQKDTPSIVDECKQEFDISESLEDSQTLSKVSEKMNADENKDAFSAVQPLTEMFEYAEISDVDQISKDDFTNEYEVVCNSTPIENSERMVTVESTDSLLQIDLYQNESVIKPLSLLCQTVVNVSNISGGSSVTAQMNLESSEETKVGTMDNFDAVSRNQQIDAQASGEFLDNANDFCEDSTINVRSSIETEFDTTKDFDVVFEEQQVDIEASDELSDNGNFSDDSMAISTHSSVSTQIAVSTKIDLKGFDTDDSSFTLDQSKITDDIEEYVNDELCLSTSLDQAQDEDQNILMDYIAEPDDFEAFTMISDTIVTPTDFSPEVEEHEDDICFVYTDNEKAMIGDDELSPTSLGIVPSTILDSYDSELGTEELGAVSRKLYPTSRTLEEESSGIYFELKESELGIKNDEFLFESTLDNIAKGTGVKFSELEFEQPEIEPTVQGSFLESENIDKNIPDPFELPSSELENYEENIHDTENIITKEPLDGTKFTADTTKKEFVCYADELSEKAAVGEYGGTEKEENTDLTLDSATENEDVEESLSVMSHFYDEWYQIDKPSAQFSLLSTDSIYAKYGATGSSESGNESDVDSVVDLGMSGNTLKSEVLSVEMSSDNITPCDELKEQFQMNQSFEKLPLENKIVDKNFEQDFLESSEKSNSETFSVEGLMDRSAVESIAEGTEFQFIHYEKSLERNVDETFESITATMELSRVHDSSVTVAISALNQTSDESISSTKELCRVQDSSEMAASDQTFVQSQEISVENKYSTSKSCQTEDSFEEDIFFDSFDDTFTIPSYLHFPIDERAKPPTCEISVQCDLISSQDSILSKTVLVSVAVPQEQQIPFDIQASTCLPKYSEESKISDTQIKERGEATDAKEEESSCESFEDSDSDLFIESHSSHDEFEVDNKRRGLLYAEIDSDTGFSSGSECGWTKQKSYKEKHFGKGKKICEVTVVEGSEVVSEYLSEQVSTTSVSSSKEETSSSVECEMLKPSIETVQSVESKIIEAIDSVEKDIEKIKMESSKESQKFSEVPLADQCISVLPSDIIERAVTPVAIPQYPSFENDLIFVEVEASAEVIEEKEEEAVCTTPTVEYFIGPLPQSIEIESPPDVNERFFEIDSDLPETMSILSTDTSVIEQMSTEGVDDESFADAFSSDKIEDDINDSISEYYPVPQNETLPSPRESITEDEYFTMAFSDISDTPSKELSIHPMIEMSEDWKEITEGAKSMDLESGVETDFIVVKKYISLDEKIEQGTKEFNLIKNTSIIENLHKDISSMSNLKSAVSGVVPSDVLATSPSEGSSKTKLDAKLTPEKSATSKEVLVVNLKEKNVEVGTTSESVITEISVVDESPAFVDPEFSKLEICNSEKENIINDENEIAKASSYIPPVPSDIVRYLYYDDSVTFDDDSFHSQSENLEIPSLTTEDVQPVVTSCDAFTDLKEQIKSVNEIAPKSTKLCYEAGTEPCIREESIKDNFCSQPIDTFICKPDSSNVPVEKSTEIVVKNIQKQELSIPLKEVLSSILTEPDLKTTTCEDLDSDNIDDYPTVSQPEENIDRNISKLDSSVNISQDEIQDTAPTAEFRQTSPYVPQVPSDIVRYLYYGDDITFDEASFHSQSDDLIESELLSDEVPPSGIDIDSNLEIKAAVAVISKVLEEEVTPLVPAELEDETSTKLISALEHSEISDKELSIKNDSSSFRVETAEFDNSESIDKWFELEEDKSAYSINGKKEKVSDSDHFSATKSSGLKDSEQPCIPEIILSPKQEDNFCAAKVDIDEVTDISTHFTMTDESDKFSDIESDTSLNIEDECILPFELESPQTPTENNMKFEFDEINITTPNLIELNVKDASSKLTDLLPKEKFIKYSVSDELEKQAEEMFDECITSSKLEESSKEEFYKYLTPVDVIEYSEIFDECMTSSKLEQSLKEESVKCPIPVDVLEHSEIFDECVTSSKLEESPKEESVRCSTTVDVIEHSEIFDECINSNKLKLSSKEESAKHLTVELLENSEIFDECITSNKLEQLLSEESVKCSTPVDVLEYSEIFDADVSQYSEVFDECITSSKVEQSFKEESDKSSTHVDVLEQSDIFDECITSSKLEESPKEESVKSVDGIEHLEECITSSKLKQSAKEESAECSTSADILQHSFFDEYITSSKLEHTSKEESAKCSTTVDVLEYSEVFDECITSNEYSEQCQGNLADCLNLDKISDQQQNKDVTPHSILVDHTQEVVIEKSTECLVSDVTFPVQDENGNIPELAVVEKILEETHIFPQISDIQINAQRQDVCLPVINATGASTTVDKLIDQDIDVSSCATPNVESLSVSTEVTEDWSDAESKNFEIDESIYDLPSEGTNEINMLSTDVLTDKSHEESVAQSSCLFYSDKDNFGVISTEATQFKSERIEIKNEKSDKVVEDFPFTECKDSIKIALEDSSIEKKDTKIEKDVAIHEYIIHDTKSEIYETSAVASFFDVSEQDSKPYPDSTDNSLLPDLKNISEIKMEREPEINIVPEEKVNIESMSAAPGREPNFFLQRTISDAQEVGSQKTTSKELCVEEEVITGAQRDFSQLDQSNENFESSTVTDNTLELSHLVSESVSKILSPKNMNEEKFEILGPVYAEKEVISEELPENIQDEIITEITKYSFEDSRCKIYEETKPVEYTSQIAYPSEVNPNSDILKIEDASTLKDVSSLVELDSKRSVISDLNGNDTEITKATCINERKDVPSPLEPVVSFVQPEIKSIEETELEISKVDATEEFVPYFGCGSSIIVKESTEHEQQSFDEFLVVDFKGGNSEKSYEIGDENNLKSAGKCIAVESKLSTSVEAQFSNSENINVSFEKVDFKGGSIVEETVDSECKKLPAAEKIDNLQSKFDKKVFKDKENNETLDIVDFKGQFLMEDSETHSEFQKTVSNECFDFKGIISLSSGKLKEEESNTIQKRESYLKRLSESQLETPSVYGEQDKTKETVKQKEIEYTSKFGLLKKSDRDEGDKTLEIVDFKGCISAAEIQQPQQTELTKVNVLKLHEKSFLDKSSETISAIDFTRHIDTDYSEADIQIDTSKQDADTILSEDQKTIDIYSIIKYEVSREPQIKTESVENVYFTTADSMSNSISEESSGLYSCIDASAFADDTSMQFYSMPNNFDDTFNAISSDDFTDVASHLTSDSDKWSDVEGDFSFEDAELDREKAPVRPQDEEIIYFDQKELEKATAFIQKSETVSCVNLKESKILKELQIASMDVTVEDEIKEPESIQQTFEFAGVSNICETNVIEGKTSKDPTHETTESSLMPSTTITKYIAKGITDETETVEQDEKELYVHKEKSEIGSFKQMDENEINANLVQDSNAKVPQILSTSTNISTSSDIVDSLMVKDFKESADFSVVKAEIMFSDSQMYENSCPSNIKSTCVYKDLQVLDTNEAVLMESSVDADLPSVDISNKDLSSVTSTEDFADLSYHLSTEESERWSDVENEIYTDELRYDSKNCIPEDDNIFIAVSDVNIPVEMTPTNNNLNLTLQNKDSITKDIQEQSEKDETSTETPLMEYFADIKSINESLTVADTFCSFDAETAIPKTHEDVTDVSTQFEKTESENWLEAETENSVSEFDEDVVVLTGIDQEMYNHDYKRTVDEANSTVPSLQQYSDLAYYDTTSTSSMFSDTCADISLQCTTTDNSDKWSDIEAEVLIDDALYGNVELSDNLILPDLPQFKKQGSSEDSVEKSILPDDPIEVSDLNVSTVIESSDKLAIDKISKIESSEMVKSSPETKSEMLKSAQTLSFEGPDSSFANLTDFGQITMPTESSTSSLLSTPSNVTAAVSDDELTNVTPLDSATEESDKLSDTSGDTSIEEIDEDSSVSLKAEIKLDEKIESDAVHSIINVSEKEERNVLTSENEKKTIADKIDSSSKKFLATEESSKKSIAVNIKEGKNLTRLSEEQLAVDIKQRENAEVSIKEIESNDVESITNVSRIKEEEYALTSESVTETIADKADSSSDNFLVTEESSKKSLTLNIKEEKNLTKLSEEQYTVDVKCIENAEVSIKDQTEFIDSSTIKEDKRHFLDEIKDDVIQISEKDENKPLISTLLDVESVKEISQFAESESIEMVSKKEDSDLLEKEYKDQTQDESMPLDNFTDAPAHALTSDAFCYLECDRSVEDSENQHLEPDVECDEFVHNVGYSGQNISEYGITNSLSPDEFRENADDYALDTIPENELDHYEEEYELSEHFEINEDELIYPLPYNDWIEQSFDLKEYGVEAIFSETGSDIHGYGLANEEYDDEDIQRAIDYNLSSFDEENVENIDVGTTESFKTLSNDISPHLKVSDKEYDTWSTADAPSLEEEFAEHDDVLSKIDELLAEDFGDLDNYQTESPLEHEDFDKEHDDYFMKGISTPICLESEIDNVQTFDEDFTHVHDNLLEDTFLQIDKHSEIAELSAVSNAPQNLTKVSGKESKLIIEAENVDQVSSQASESMLLSKSKSSVATSDESKKTASHSEKIVSSEKASVIPAEEQKIMEDTLVISLKDDEAVYKLENGVRSNIIIDQKRDFLSSSDETLYTLSLTKGETNSKLESDLEIKAIDELKKDSQSFSDEKSFTLSRIKKETHSKLKSDLKSKSVDEHQKDFQTSSDESSFTLSRVKEETHSKLESDLKSEDIGEHLNDFHSTSDESSFSLSRTKGGTHSKLESHLKNKAVDELQSSQSSSDETSFTLPGTKNETHSKLGGDLKTESADENEKDFHSSSDKATFTLTISKEKADSKFDSDIKCKVIHQKESLSSAETSIALQVGDSKLKSVQLDDSISCTLEVIDSSCDIPPKVLVKTTELSAELSTIAKLKSSDRSEDIQSSVHLNKSVSATEVSDSKSNIPDLNTDKDSKSVARKQSASETLLVHLKNQLSAETDEVKPDIPKKTKRKSLGAVQSEEHLIKPSLPPKKRNSTSESPSSSVSGSLSSSLESLGSFQSATSDKSSKSSSLKTADEASVHSVSPDVPARRSRSSRLSSSTKSRESDSSSTSSTSLRIRRRSSNFIEPEPIDLSIKRASIDERMLKLQNEGKCANREKAFIAAKLIEMQFEEEDALMASRQCSSVYHAVKFLTQLCELCNCRFPINLMSSMVHCTHRACKECLKAHFTSLLYDRSIFCLLCPICHKPDITDQNIQEYFNHLDMMLRNMLEDKVYDLFQRKLRDEVLTKDPNFHWCSQCSSGFIASPRMKKLYCPDCSAITCALCHQTWELEHEGVHCERFQQWKDMHTPEPPPAGLVKFLVDRGISCPSCGIQYAQACGGCMMYKCSHCCFEFCGFCIRPIKRGKDCANKNCDSMGLHIHHLHNCLFYLRDKGICDIQMLLEEESITYLTIPPKDQIVKSRCQVREQKHIHGALSEDRCARDIEPYCGGLCRTHYYEYLAELLRKNNISPLSIMTIKDLQFMLRKSRVLVPEKMKGERSEDYYDRLLKLVESSLT